LNKVKPYSIKLKETPKGVNQKMEIKFLSKLGTQKTFSKHKIKSLLKTKLHVPMTPTCELILVLEYMQGSLPIGLLRFFIPYMVLQTWIVVPE